MSGDARAPAPPHAPPGLELGALLPGERRAAVALLADAFRDNPLNLAVLGAASAERRRAANAHGLRALLPLAERHGCVQAARLGGALAALLIAAPPHGFPLPPPSLVARLRAAFGQGFEVAARWRRVYEALHAVHPGLPHWYLGTLGVAPALQRRGVGGALLAHWLRRVDAEAQPAYLETDRPENVAFYGRAGFREHGETRVLGTRVWLLWREAAAVSPRPGLR